MTNVLLIYTTMVIIQPAIQMLVASHVRATENIDGASDGSICCIANECFFVAFVTRFKTPLYLIFSTLSRLRLISRIFSEPTEKPKTEAAVNLNEDA